MRSDVEATDEATATDDMSVDDITAAVGCVYYLRVGALVKIGYTSNMEHRLLQYPPDTKVLAVEPGGYDLEALRLRQFKPDLRYGNEWFRPSVELRSHISEVQRKHGTYRAARAASFRTPKPDTPNTTIEPMVTIAEAATIMRVSTKTVRRWITQGVIQGNRMGKRLIRIDRRELETVGRPLQYVG